MSGEDALAPAPQPTPGGKSTLSRTLTRAFASSFLLQGAGAFLSMLSSVALARLLGPAGYGAYAFAIGVVSLLAIPAQFGIGTVLVRFCASYEVQKQWDLLKGLLRWANRVVVFSSAALAAVAASVLLAVPAIVPAESRQALWIGLLLLPVVALGDLRAAALRGLRRFIKGQMPEQVLRPLVVLLVVGVLWLSGRRETFTASVAMAAYMGASLVAFLVGARWLWGALAVEVRDARPVADARVWLGAMGILSLTRGGRVLLQSIDLVLVGMIAGVEAAGVYRVATTLAATMSLGLGAVNVVASPHFSGLSVSAERSELAKLLVLSCKLALGAAVPIVAVLALFGRGIITTIYGSSFSDAFVPLMILCLAALFNAATGPVGSLLNMTGEERWPLAAVIVSLAVSVPMYFLLVPRYSAVGGAIAAATGFIVLNVILSLRAWRWLRPTHK